MHDKDIEKGVFNKSFDLEETHKYFGYEKEIMHSFKITLKFYLLYFNNKVGT